MWLKKLWIDLKRISKYIMVLWIDFSKLSQPKLLFIENNKQLWIILYTLRNKYYRWKVFLRSPVRGGRQVIKVLVLLLTARSARGVGSLVSWYCLPRVTDLFICFKLYLAHSPSSDSSYFLYPCFVLSITLPRVQMLNVQSEPRQRPVLGDENNSSFLDLTRDPNLIIWTLPSQLWLCYKKVQNDLQIYVF